MSENIYNQYVIYFETNKTLFVWAKGYEICTGIKQIKFIGTHPESDVRFVNLDKVLYVELLRKNIDLLNKSIRLNK